MRSRSFAARSALLGLFVLAPIQASAQDPAPAETRIHLTSGKTAEIYCYEPRSRDAARVKALAEIRRNPRDRTGPIATRDVRSVRMESLGQQSRGYAYVAVFDALEAATHYELRCKLADKWSNWAPVRTTQDFYPPSPAPDRVMLTFESDPARSIAVNWRTDRSVTAPVAEIAPAQADLSFMMAAKRFAGRSERVPTLEHGDVQMNTVTFAGLEPDTMYAYRVGAEAGSWSAWFQFRTAQAHPAPFTFLYFGDAQNDIRAHFSRVVRQAALDAPAARFMLYAGDIVERGDSDEMWGQLHESLGWLGGTIPTLPVIGNHEYIRTAGFSRGPHKLEELPHWQANFALPRNGPKGLEERAYFVDFQGVRVIALDCVVAVPSNDPAGSGYQGPVRDGARLQAQWLEKVLANNPNRWTVVAFHYPLFSFSQGDVSRTMRESWQPIFDKHGVDLVLQGHEHVYARTRTTAASRPPQSRADSGPVYVQSVGMGWPLGLGGQTASRPANVDGYQRAGDRIALYQIVRVDGDRLGFEAHLPDGSLYDAFDLVKGSTGAPNHLVERMADAPKRQFAAASPVRPGELRDIDPAQLGKFVGLYCAFEGIYYGLYAHEVTLKGSALRMSLARSGGTVLLRPVSDLAFAGVSDRNVTVRARFLLGEKGQPIRLEVQEGDFLPTIAERRL